MTTHDGGDVSAAELELERFLSGAMEGDGAAEFLARCEAEPDRWRAVALGAIEEHRLVSALRGTATGSGTGPEARPAARTRQTARAMTAMAALALVACGMVAGYGIGIRAPNGTAGQTSPAVASTNPPQRGPSPERPPVVSAGRLLPDAARRILRDAGIEVREEPVVYLVDGEHGERWAVPETHVSIRLARDDGGRP